MFVKRVWLNLMLWIYHAAHVEMNERTVTPQSAPVDLSSPGNSPKPKPRDQTSCLGNGNMEMAERTLLG